MTPRTVACQAPLSIRVSRQRILEEVAISFSRGSSWPRDQICVSFTTCIGRQVFPPSTTWEKWPSCSSFSFYIIVIIIIPFIENLLCARRCCECAPHLSWFYSHNNQWNRCSHHYPCVGKETNAERETMKFFHGHTAPLYCISLFIIKKLRLRKVK